MYKVVKKKEVVKSLQTSEEKHVNVAERPCRSCENFIGVSIPHNVDIFNRFPLDCYYACRNGLFLLATTGNHNTCPINSFKYREKGEVELTPESLSKNGFKQLSYEKDLSNKLNPNHPCVKRYGEILVHPGEDLLRFMYQTYDVWVKEKDEKTRGIRRKC